MFWLIFGLLIWSGAHLFKRVLPDARKKAEAKLGNGIRGMIALLLVISIVFMVVGYRQMPAHDLWVLPHWTHYIAILMNFLAVVLIGASNSKSRLRGQLRHPMLTGMIIWSVAHIMVAGSWRGLILWAGMMIWSFVEIRVINAQESDYTPYKNGTLKGDIRLGVIALVLTAIIMGIHHWIRH